MKLLRALRNVKYRNGILNKGEIVFVTEENRIVQGPFINEILQGYDCEYVDVTALAQENLQRLEEVKGLQSKVESLTEYSKRKSNEIRILNEDVGKAWAAFTDEYAERALLEATLERALLDHQPVVLPMEVAEAIDHCKSVGFQGFRIISCIPVISQLFRDYQASTIEALKVIREFAFTRSDGEETILKALGSGYSVEQPMDEVNEEAFRFGMNEIYKEMDELKYSEKFNWQSELTDKIIPLIKEIYKH